MRYLALKKKESQNFKPKGGVEIIDAGPSLDGRSKEIKTIKNNQSEKIKSFGLPEKQFSGLISNTDLKGFRVVRSDFSFDGEKVSIHRNLIKILKLGTNSKVAINV
jgi:Arginine/ornithine N-succinyltransferase beta subunit